jgi:ABC-type lipoprotein export system ATPase subunit
VLADEPTGNLDSETAADINALFAQLVEQGKTLLIVTHDANLAQVAARVIELKDGAVFADRKQLQAAV